MRITSRGGFLLIHDRVQDTSRKNRIIAVEPLWIALLLTGLVALGALGALVVAAWRRRAGGDLAELRGSLNMLAESQSQLSRALQERLDTVDQRMGKSLYESAEKTARSLGELHQRLVTIDKAQENITKLSADVVGLQDILANKQARGAFGEIQLNDIVKSALPPNAYDLQPTLSNGRRADCLIRLPQPPGPIVIDAKFPLESYQRLVDARQTPEQKKREQEFRADILRHVNHIAERYIVPGETAESALMFLPSEAIYAELHAYFRDVVEESFRKRVWIVSPTTMMATLNTVRAVLKDAQMREQAHRIQAEVGKMMQDVRRLEDRVGRLQSHFQLADKDIREISISTDKITRHAGRIEEVEFEENDGPRLVPDAGSRAGAGN